MSYAGNYDYITSRMVEVRLRAMWKRLAARPDLNSCRYRSVWDKHAADMFREIGNILRRYIRDLRRGNDLSMSDVVYLHSIAGTTQFNKAALNSGAFDKLVGAFNRGFVPCDLNDRLPLEFRCVAPHWPLPDFTNIGLVSAYLTYKDLINGKRTSIRPGRFLRMAWPTMGAERVKHLTEQFHSVVKPPELYFVENDDPDGWEWVYEHGYGFQSCMTYDRPDRHLERGLCGPLHPVRAYALPGNGLRLAWIGDKDEGRVYARSIVVDTEDVKGYVRVYGDTRLAHALSCAGYRLRVGMEGVRIRKIEHPTKNAYIVPYIDGSDSAEDEGDTLLLGDGPIDVQNACGHTGDEAQCPNCGAGVDDEEDIHYTYDDRGYCWNCEHNVVRAIVGMYRGHYEYGPMFEDDCVEAADGEYIYIHAIEECEYSHCSQCDGLSREVDMTYTREGFVCNCTETVSLDVPDDEGCCHAIADNAIWVCSVSDLEVELLAEVHSMDFNIDGLSADGEYVIQNSRAHEALLEEGVEG